MTCNKTLHKTLDDFPSVKPNTSHSLVPAISTSLTQDELSSKNVRVRYLSSKYINSFLQNWYGLFNGKFDEYVRNISNICCHLIDMHNMSINDLTQLR